jgi:hypothetical protein
MMGKVKTALMIDGAIATGVHSAVEPLGNKRTFQAIGNTSAGAGASTIEIQVSNDGTNFHTVDTLSLTLSTTVSSDVYETAAPWKFVRGNVATISGTDATVSLIMGVQL